MTEVTPVRVTTPLVKTANRQRKGLPAFIWVIGTKTLSYGGHLTGQNMTIFDFPGGPGSNKGIVCNQALRNIPGWVHVNIGELLRNMASSNIIIDDAVLSGEICPLDIVMQVIEQQVLMNRDTDGIIMNGFPRDLNQLQEFQSKVSYLRLFRMPSIINEVFECGHPKLRASTTYRVNFLCSLDRNRLWFCSTVRNFSLAEEEVTIACRRSERDWKFSVK